MHASIPNSTRVFDTDVLRMSNRHSVRRLCTSLCSRRTSEATMPKFDGPHNIIRQTRWTLRVQIAMTIYPCSTNVLNWANTAESQHQTYQIQRLYSHVVGANIRGLRLSDLYRIECDRSYTSNQRQHRQYNSNYSDHVILCAFVRRDCVFFGLCVIVVVVRTIMHTFRAAELEPTRAHTGESLWVEGIGRTKLNTRSAVNVSQFLFASTVLVLYTFFSLLVQSQLAGTLLDWYTCTTIDGCDGADLTLGAVVVVSGRRVIVLLSVTNAFLFRTVFSNYTPCCSVALVCIRYVSTVYLRHGK